MHSGISSCQKKLLVFSASSEVKPSTLEMGLMDPIERPARGLLGPVVVELTKPSSRTYWRSTIEAAKI